MKVHNQPTERQMPEDVRNALSEARRRKGFDPKLYVSEKAKLINSYMDKFSLKACVVGISGGIDSAVVLGIVAEAMRTPGSPICHIVPILMPAFIEGAATNQNEAFERGSAVCLKFGIQPISIPVYEPHSSIKNLVESKMGIQGDGWTDGQLAANCRTPILYHSATLLFKNGLPAVVCGTTNMDEGAYLGYFGKSSDGLVDLQIVSDVHKSEIRSVGSFLGVPSETIDAPPSGDMYDGRIDEEVFGTSYDFVEAFLIRKNEIFAKRNDPFSSISAASREWFEGESVKLERMHEYNRHKYLGSSPAVHLDFDAPCFDESWNVNSKKRPYPIWERRSPEAFVNEIFISNPPTAHDEALGLLKKTVSIGKNEISEIRNLLAKSEIEWLLSETKNLPWLKVGKYGRKGRLETTDSGGSYRQSWHSFEFAETLYRRLSLMFPKMQIFENDSDILEGERIWSFVGVNPLMRIIRYSEGDFLVPHYDDSHQFEKGLKTLKSLVVYLEDRGSTRFIDDGGLTEEYEDRNETADSSSVLVEIPSKAGDAIAFDHRILHDSPPLASGSKTIIRTDLIFKAPHFGFELR